MCSKKKKETKTVGKKGEEALEDGFETVAQGTAKTPIFIFSKKKYFLFLSEYFKIAHFARHWNESSSN